MEAFGKRRTGGNLGNKETAVGLTIASANVDISKDNRQQRRIRLQRARNDDEFRAEKVRHLKTIILRGEYDIDPRKVARSILCATISWPVEKRLIQSIIIELTELLSLAEKETVAGDEMLAQSRGSKEPSPIRMGNFRPSLPSRCNKPSLYDLSRKIPC